jgi:uncharacterized protein YggE
MGMRILALLLCTCAAPDLLAQQTARRLVRAIGEASVSVRPDAARVTISVVKQAATAEAAASDNAVTTAAVIAVLRQLLGTNGEIRTVAYHLTPVYLYPRDNTPPQITGFSASNTIQAVANDTNLAGKIVDAAIAAGATRVDGVGLFLRDDDATRAQALRVASQRARTKADAIALGLGIRLGAVLMAQEGVTSPILPLNRIDTGATATTTPTPIEAGTLDVRATVTLDIEIVP